MLSAGGGAGTCAVPLAGVGGFVSDGMLLGVLLTAGSAGVFVGCLPLRFPLVGRGFDVDVDVVTGIGVMAGEGAGAGVGKGDRAGKVKVPLTTGRGDGALEPDAEADADMLRAGRVMDNEGYCGGTDIVIGRAGAGVDKRGSSRLFSFTSRNRRASSRPMG